MTTMAEGRKDEIALSIANKKTVVAAAGALLRGALFGTR
jgi:hypothetical protein